MAVRRKQAAYGLTNFKALPADDAGGAEGVFEAIVSVFGNTDLVGDRVVKGAFAKSLNRWKESGDPISLYWDHDWSNPESNIGEVLEAEERDEGLWVKAQIDIEEPRARQVFEKMKRRRLREFSFAFDVVDEKKAADGVNELRELELLEVTTTFKGANPDTSLISIKREVQELATEIAGLKSGRVLSAKNESKVREAVGLLTDVLEAVEKEEEEQKAAVEQSGRSMSSPSVDGEKSSVEESARSMTPADALLHVRMLAAM